MFIALYHILANLTAPVTEAAMSGIASTIAIAIIIIICIRIVMGLIGVQTSGSTSTVVVKAIVDAIGYIFQRMFIGISWILTKIVQAVPMLYRKSKSFYMRKGLNNAISTILAVLTATIFIIIII